MGSPGFIPELGTGVPGEKMTPIKIHRELLDRIGELPQDAR
jgi:hypothetical protein